MKKKMLRSILSALLLTALVGSAGMLLRQNTDYHSGDTSYEAALELAQLREQEPLHELAEIEQSMHQKPQPGAYSVEEIPDEPVPMGGQEPSAEHDPYLETLGAVDLAALRQINPDVLGWIVIPGTQIEYPLMRGTDNNYYLNNTWDRKPSSVGSIFLECQNSPDLSDFNTIIYGHRMKNGSMFAALKYYDDPAYFAEHPYVYIVSDGGVRRYEIFAAYEAAVVSRTYQLGGFTGESRQTFLDSCLERSVIDTGVAPSVSDRVLTLSTCTGRGYDTRWVVQARLTAAEDAAR